MKKKHLIFGVIGIVIIIFSNLYLGKIKSDTDFSLIHLTNIASADSEYVRPLAQKPDGTYCCKNTQYTECSAQVLCD